MEDYLVFRLYGPMASWGEIAVGEARHTASYPSKSAICGLIGAALGIGREDDSAHQALAQGYTQAIKGIRSGHFLKDYHTAQAPDSVGKFRYQTRRDELVIGKARLGTILSNREYRSDAMAVVALHQTENSPYTLAEIQIALQFPKFHLYLGRKSCPLAAPLKPVLVQANGFRAALDTYEPGNLLIDPAGEWASESRWLPEDTLTHYYWEGDVEAFADEEDGFLSERVQKLVRHDLPLSRWRWQFQPRREYLWLHDRRSN